MTGTSQFLTTGKFGSSFFDTELYSAGEGVRPRLTTPDYFTKLIIPVLSLCGSIAGVLKDQPRVALALGVLAAISTLGSAAPNIYHRIVLWRRQRRDDRLARDVWPDLLMLVDQFGKFIDSGRCDTVHAIVTRCNTPSDLTLAQTVRQQEFVPVSVLWGAWDQLAHNRYNSSPDRFRLQDSISLFTWLIGTYQYYAVQAVFQRGALALRDALTPDQKRDLSMCRDVFIRFAEDYRTFVDKTGRRATTIALSAPPLVRVPPL